MVNAYKPELTNLQEGILRLLFVKAGTTLNQRRIAQLLEVSAPAVMKALPLLEKKELIKLIQDKESKRWSIELNQEDTLVIGLKRADNLKQLYESDLINFLKTEFPGTTVILFGSYAEGEDTIQSDIDLAVIGSSKKEVNLKRFTSTLEREIIINFYNSFQKIDKHLLNNILTGITLHGAVAL